MSDHGPPPLQQQQPHVEPPPQLSFECPHCQVRLAVSSAQAGTATTCPKCGGKFQIPLPAARMAAANVRSNTASTEEVQSFARKKITAGVLGILLGGLGIHKFMLGLNKPATIMLVVWLAGILFCFFILPFFATVAMNLIGFIEGIIYLTKSDEDFYQTYAIERKEWF